MSHRDLTEHSSASSLSSSTLSNNSSSTPITTALASLPLSSKSEEEPLGTVINLEYLPPKQRELAKTLFATMGIRDLTTAEKLIRQGVPLNVVNSQGETLLTRATSFASPRMLTALLTNPECRELVNRAGPSGPPLVVAAKANFASFLHFQSAVILLEQGATFEAAEKWLTCELSEISPSSEEFTQYRRHSTIPMGDELAWLNYQADTKDWVNRISTTLELFKKRYQEELATSKIGKAETKQKVNDSVPTTDNLSASDSISEPFSSSSSSTSSQNTPPETKERLPSSTASNNSLPIPITTVPTSLPLPPKTKEKPLDTAIGLKDLPPQQQKLAKALFAAVEKSDLVTVQKLIDQGAPLNVKTNQGATPLAKAAFSFCDKQFFSFDNIVVELLEGGASFGEAERWLIAKSSGEGLSEIDEEEYDRNSIFIFPQAEEHAEALANLRFINECHQAEVAALASIKTKIKQKAVTLTLLDLQSQPELGALVETLFAAVWQGNVAAIEDLIAQDVPLNIRVDAYSTLINYRCQTPLHLATKEGILPIIKALLKTQRGRSTINQRDSDQYSGQTPLHYVFKIADSDKRLAIISEFLKTQEGLAAIKQADSSGNTPLHLAAHIGDIAAVAAFLNTQEGHDATSQQNWHGDTPLLIAVSEAHLPIVKALLNTPKGYSTVNQANKKGSTPIYRASCKCSFADFLPTKILRSEKGLSHIKHDESTFKESDSISLVVSTIEKYLEIGIILLEYGANWDWQAVENYTAKITLFSPEDLTFLIRVLSSIQYQEAGKWVARNERSYTVKEANSNIMSKAFIEKELGPVDIWL